MRFTRSLSSMFQGRLSPFFFNQYFLRKLFPLESVILCLPELKRSLKIVQRNIANIAFQPYSTTRGAASAKRLIVAMENPVGINENKSQKLASKDQPSPSNSKDLSAVIFRYKPGDDRFQVTITLKARKFNFDRPVKETIASFLERVKTNIGKKVKKFDIETPICLIVGTEEYSLTNSNPFPVSGISEAAIGTVKVRLGDEETVVDINPPEVTSIKFLKQAIVGLPLLPLKIEGSSNFQLSSSEFLWESYLEEDEEADMEKKPRIRKLSKQNWDWIPKSQRSRTLVYTPTDCDANAFFRFTCFPSDGQAFGFPLTVELPQKVRQPPVQNFLFRERLKAMKPFTKSSNTFRVISYNALSELLTTPEWFTASPKESLDIDYRLPLLTAELRAYDGDILCLQEIDEKHFERNFTMLFSDCGYRGTFSLKSGETSSEGLATFYNPSKFELLQTETLNLREEMVRMPFYPSLMEVPGLADRLQDRNTVLQISTFQQVNSSCVFLVANTHLYFKPDADHIRLLQTITCLRYLEKKLELVKSKYLGNSVGVIFCGDFNCTPPFGCYRLATGGKITEDDEDWTSHETEKVTGISFEHNLELSTAFPANELTTILINFEGCIDYIFYQPHFLRLVNRFSPPSKAQISKLIGVDESGVSLPNFHAPSDHLPIIADFSTT